MLAHTEGLPHLWETGEDRGKKTFVMTQQGNLQITDAVCVSNQLSLVLKRFSTRMTTYLWRDENISDEVRQNSAELLSILSKWQWFPCWEQARTSKPGWLWDMRVCTGKGVVAHSSLEHSRVLDMQLNSTQHNPESQIIKLQQTWSFRILMSSWFSWL